MSVQHTHASADSVSQASSDAKASRFSIGELAAHVGVTPEAIRYYEREAIIPPAARVGSGHYRQYSTDDAARLQFVKRARDFGFTLLEVRALIALDSAATEAQCDDVSRIAQAHLERVNVKVLELQALQSSLHQLIASCGRGRDGSGEGCGILGELEGRIAPSSDIAG